jgi:hypothetical protein
MPTETRTTDHHLLRRVRAAVEAMKIGLAIRFGSRPERRIATKDRRVNPYVRRPDADPRSGQERRFQVPKP